MVEMRALIDNDSYFNRIADFYRMFSFDLTYYTDRIHIEPRRITRISTRSMSHILQTLLRYGREGERSFVIATHGNPDGFPIPIRAGNAATMNSDFMDQADAALRGRAEGRQFVMSYEANGVRVFQNERQLDDLLGLIRSVRQLHLEHLEFRGCNMGAGTALRSLHKLLGARLTAAPTVQFLWARLSTATYRTISAERFAELLQQLPQERRTFTAVDCYRAGSSANENDIVIAFARDGNSLQLRARSVDMIKGWSQFYMQHSTLFAFNEEPSGGGYRPRGQLPIIGFLTPHGRKPFVFPGDMFDYTEYLAHEMQPPQTIP